MFRERLHRLIVFTPFEGTPCTVLVGWHIDSGTMGDVSLDGFNVALAIHIAGHMMQVPWSVALYLDERASQAQQNALTQIFAGQAGGHFAALGGHIGEVLGVKGVAIDYQAEGKRRSFRIPAIAEVEIEGLEGGGGAEVTISGNPLGIVPGEPMLVGRSTRFSYHDHGMDWEISAKNGFYSPFTYQGP